MLREDIAKLDRLDAETRFLGKQHISTIGELTAHRETASAEIDALTAQRQELRKELRRLDLTLSASRSAIWPRHLDKESLQDNGGAV